MIPISLYFAHSVLPSSLNKGECEELLLVQTHFPYFTQIFHGGSWGQRKGKHRCQDNLLQWEPHGSQRQTYLGLSHIFSTEKRLVFRDSVDLPEPQFLVCEKECNSS